MERHANQFLTILNGQAVKKLQSFNEIDFNIAISKLKPSVVGQRWNSQHTWGIASMNIRKNKPGDLVNRPTLKRENVLDGILPQFVALSKLLLEVDKNHDFYCGLLVGNQQRMDHAQRLMEEDILIPEDVQKQNVLESVSGICNVYFKASQRDMFSRSHKLAFGVDHSVPVATQQASWITPTKKDKMKAKFHQWGVNDKFVILFPHIDDFNGRQPGHNFLGCLSRTLVCAGNHSSRNKHVTMQWQVMTFCQ
jgi:hypothetical protein